MVEVMDRHGIDQMWISSSTGLARDFVQSNRRMAEFIAEYPDRFLGYLTVNPNYHEMVESEVRECIERLGFRAIKLHPWLQAFSVHLPVVHHIMELAREYRVPVMFHDGTPPYSDTLQIAALADTHPETDIILGHAGMFDSYRAAIEACNTHENIWLCICGTIVGDTREIFEKARHDRLLFGTDFGASDRENLVVDRIKIIDYACHDEALRQDVMENNALRLLARF
jgi:predicted TIM-barrel fold metal-dependent hydrolase